MWPRIEFLSEHFQVVLLFISYQVGLHDLKHFMDVKPIRFFDKFVDIKGQLHNSGLCCIG